METNRFLFILFIVHLVVKTFLPNQKVILELIFQKKIIKFIQMIVIEFLIESNAKVKTSDKNCWINIYYEIFDATIYITYKKINSDLNKILGIIVSLYLTIP